MCKEVTYGSYEYRMQGGEMHRRPIDREGLPPWEGAWLVMNQPHHHVPQVVRDQFTQSSSLRFD